MDRRAAAQAGDEGLRLPMSERGLGEKPLAFQATAAQAGHLGGGSGLVQEDEPVRISGAHLRDSYYVETQLAPTLQPGDIVILDNLPAHKSAPAEAAIRAKGAWLLFLPPYSPDLNPIEMAFAKLKTLLRARAIRTIDALWRAIGEICDLFSPQECRNNFAAAGYRFIMKVRRSSRTDGLAVRLGRRQAGWEGVTLKKRPSSRASRIAPT